MAIQNGINANSTTPLPTTGGGTGVNTPTTAATAGQYAAWDANKNMAFNNYVSGYTTTVTAAGTTVLTVASTYQQFFTGSTTQTVTMPVVSTLALGQQFLIVNLSSGAVTVQSSGGNTIVTLAANSQADLTCISLSGTGSGSWQSDYDLNNAGVASITGTANQVIASAPTGNITLSTPQDIATSSNVTFNSLSTTSVAFQGNGQTIKSADGFAALSIFNGGGTSVNSAGVAGGATGVQPQIFMSGSDTDVGLKNTMKGAGVFSVTSTSSSPFVIGSGTGIQHTSTFTFPNTAASRTYTFPDATGTIALTAGSGGLKSFTVLTSGTAATYTTPAGITSLLVEVLGPGGGGGGSTGGASTISQGAGGGSGGYARLWIPSAAASYTYTVGTGGAAGTAGGGSGGTGTTTTFSASSLQATSGTGGVGMGAISIAGGSASIAGNPGVGTNGIINTHGEQGSFGFVAFGVINGGLGGSTYFGGGGYTTAVGTTQAPSFGGGGAGGSSSTVNTAGSAGGGGLIVVWEFA